MSLITVIVTLLVVGFVMWLINTYVPMSAGMKKLLNIAVVVIVILWLLAGFGILSHLGNVHS